MQSLDAVMLDTPIQFEHRPLPWVLSMANALMKRLGVQNPRLTPEHLTAVAARDAGLAPLFPAHVGDALEVLCRSLRDDAALHWFGKMNYWEVLVGGLSALLKVEHAFRVDPSLAETPLVPPLVLTGLPRSGTTFLHRLLSAVEDAAPVALYQLLQPIPPGPIDLRYARAWLTFEPWRRASRPYGMDAMHLIRPDLPDECNWAMRMTGRSVLLWSMAPTLGYLRWLMKQDLRETYQFYRKVLILLQKQMPGRRLTLKCPHHMAWLPALREALPEAHLLMTHRDPLQTVVSSCKLSLSTQALATDHLDFTRIMPHLLLKEHTYTANALAFADSPQGQSLLHVDYRQLVKEPLAVARQVYQTFKLPFTEHQEAALTRFIANNRQHKHGPNPYSTDQFALSTDGLKALFRDYRTRFELGMA